ncbi:hypothetical protein BDZ97DRAFT_1969721 [Flammula alnicola]|nr:hypothetical protein BDZ97DRAFT_1969721 [Flammula alnicola]
MIPTVELLARRPLVLKCGRFPSAQACRCISEIATTCFISLCVRKIGISLGFCVPVHERIPRHPHEPHYLNVKLVNEIQAARDVRIVRRFKQSGLWCLDRKLPLIFSPLLSWSRYKPAIFYCVSTMPAILLPTPIHSTIASRPKSSIQVTKDVVRLRRQNRLRPVLQLCHDVVEYIFLLGASLEHNSRSVRRTIISYSQTCHDWRTVALATKPLWTQLIDFERRSLEWNDEMLRRSHPLPFHLTFQFSAARQRDPRRLSAQQDYIDRFQSYSIVCPEAYWNDLLQGLESPAPNIETLRIARSRTLTPTNPIPTPLPASLFAGYAPKLRRLEMAECMVDFRAPVLRALTSLHVADLHLENAPSPEQWLYYLTLMPSLTELFLEGAMISSGPTRREGLSTDPDIDDRLPMISILQLDAATDDIGMMLAHLPMPPRPKWSLLCADARPGRALDEVMQVFERGVGVRGRGAYLNDNMNLDLEPDDEDDDGCTLTLAARDKDVYIHSQPAPDFRSHTYGSHHAAPNPFSIYVNLHLADADRHHWDTLFPSAMAALGGTISRVTALEMNMPYVPADALLPVLRRAERVERLVRLSGAMTKALLPLLQAPSSPSHSPSSHTEDHSAPLPLPLPSLKTLTFTDERAMWGQSYLALVAFLRWRKAQGVSIRDVYFGSCCVVLEEKKGEMAKLGVRVEGGGTGEGAPVRWWNM